MKRSDVGEFVTTVVFLQQAAVFHFIEGGDDGAAARAEVFGEACLRERQVEGKTQTVPRSRCPRRRRIGL